MTCMGEVVIVEKVSDTPSSLKEKITRTKTWPWGRDYTLCHCAWCMGPAHDNKRARYVLHYTGGAVVSVVEPAGCRVLCTARW